MRIRLVLALGALACTSSASAGAQAPTDDATARALFDEARKLMDQGNFAVACPKLEEGQRLSPGIGMKFNLAECYERSGKLASAWAAFLDVAALSKAAGQLDRETAARRRARALELDLVRVQIEVPQASRVEGLEIRRDGALVGVGQWGTAIPADPGDHLVTATAPGRIKYEHTITLAASSGTVETLNIPLLPIDPRSTEKPTNVVTPPVQRTSVLRTVGFVSGGAGVVGLGVGTAFGIIAMNKYSQSTSYCFPGNQCLPDGITLRHDAISAGTISTVGFVAGAVLIAVGVTLILTAPSGTEPAKSARWLSPVSASGLAF